MKIGFVSDIHEDIIRLKKAFEILRKEKCDTLVCLGDFVGYSVPYCGFLRSRNAHDVIQLIKKKCDVIVAGNHDFFAIRKLSKHRAGFPYPQNWYSLSFQKRQKLSRGRIYLYEGNELSALLTDEDKKFIANLPEYVVKTYGELTILFSHYAYPDLVGMTTFEPKTPYHVKSHFEFMKRHRCTLSISGHDHKEGIMLFTRDSIREVSFGTIPLPHEETWLHGPCVVNSSFSNGVMVLDTEKLEIKSLPLTSAMGHPQLSNNFPKGFLLGVHF